jgi:hypothetical protein
MSEQQDGVVAADREAAKEADELAHFGPSVFVASVGVGRGIDNDEARLNPFDDS